MKFLDKRGFFIIKIILLQVCTIIFMLLKKMKITFNHIGHDIISDRI